MDAREERGLIIAQNSKIVKTPVGWKVPSQSGNGSYIVNLDHGTPFCTCPDFEKRQQPRPRPHPALPRQDAMRFGRQYYTLGIVLSAAILAVYIITRTTGVPFLGPDAGVEPLTPLSLVPAVENVPLLYCLARLRRATKVSLLSS